MADVLNGKKIDARLPIPLTVVTKANVEKEKPAF
jgi:ribose transport system substrate-binding protein